MKNENTKTCLATWIILLFIFSTIAPLAIGYDAEIADRELMDDLAYGCYDNCNSSRIAYYREYLQEYSSDNNLESDRTDFLEESCAENVTEIVEIEPNVLSVDGPMDSPWPMKCQNNRHTGLSPYSTADNYGAEKWRFETDGWIEGGPAIGDDGTIYFESFDGYFYALYPNGTMKWRTGGGGVGFASASIDKDGTIYLGGNQKLYAINPNGTRKWSFYLGSSQTHIGHSSPAIGDDGTIYIGTHIISSAGGDIIAVNPDGTERWRKRIANNWVESSPCIGADGTIYIGSSS